MPVSEVHHVAVTVSDVERSADFYEKALGYTRTLRSDVEAEDVLRAMGAIWMVSDGDEFPEQAMRILRLVLDGLRYRA